MNKGINLLPNKKRQNVSDEKIVSLLRQVSLFALIVIVFLTLTLFALNYDTTLPRLRRQENTTLTNLTLLHNKTAKLLIIKDRLQQISLLLHSRGSYDSLITQISQLAPNDVTVDNFSVVSGKVTINLSSPSLSSLGNLLDTMTDMINNKQTFKSITIDDLVADNSTLRYSLSIKAQLL